MYFLDPVYHNSIGANFLIRDNLDTKDVGKIQLQIEEIAIILDKKEITKLLKRTIFEIQIHSILDLNNRD